MPPIMTGKPTLWRERNLKFDRSKAESDSLEEFYKAELVAMLLSNACTDDIS